MRSNVITGAQVYNNLLSNPFRDDQLRLLVNRPPTPPLSHNFVLSEKKVLMLIGGGWLVIYNLNKYYNWSPFRNFLPQKSKEIK